MKTIKRVALAVLLMLSPFATAIAATCTCNSGLTCNLQGADADWNDNGAGADGGTCDAGVGATSDVVVSSGGIASMNATNTLNTVRVDSGGTFACVNDSTARVLTIDNHLPTGASNEFYFWAKAGSTFDCDGATGVEGVDLTITYSGTVPAGGVKFLVGDGAFSTFNLTTDATFKFRGLKRASTAVTNVAAGATDDFVWCTDLSAGLSGAQIGDTIVFTGGRFDGYFGRVDSRPDSCTGAGAPDASCTGADATAECSAVACGGGPCDLQIDMNDADRAFLSMTKVANLGGPSREPTPDDTDANGTADNDTMFPVDGDTAEVFKPSIIQGGANAITGGVQIYFAGVQANVRYLNWRGLVSDQSSGICTAAGSVNTASAVHPTAVASIAPEGDFSFINIYDAATVVSVEFNATDRTEDSRPNYPLTMRYWYNHDPDANVAGTCTDAQKRVGSGIVIGTDNISDTYRIDGWTFDHFHFARLNNEVVNNSGPQITTASTYKNVLFLNPIIHDIPFNTTYQTTTASARFVWGHGQGQMLGGAVWDVGAAGASPATIGIYPLAILTSPQAMNNFRIQNLFLVNYDVNDVTPNTGGVNLAANLGGASISTDTSLLRVSNSYIANGVGGGGKAGTWFFNFLRNTNIDDAAGACASRRAALEFPVLAYGNVVTADKAVSCWSAGIGGFHDTYGQPSIFSTQARKWISNVIASPQNHGATTAGIHLRTSGTAETLSNDIYNNLIDLANVDSAAEYGIAAEITTATGSPKVTTRYNVLGRVRSNGIVPPTAGGTFDSGYNRFYRITSNNYQVCAGACSGDLYPNDTESDLNDFMLLPSTGLYHPACSDTLRTAGPWAGPIGPLAYGIRDFGYFHPAALAAMNAAVWKYRYNWLMCSGANQDAIPR